MTAPPASPPGRLGLGEMFTVGIGPSSSHTVGPMRAAAGFAAHLRRSGLLAAVAGIRVELLGSLGATGPGHGTPDAVVLGLEGHRPETVDPVAGVARRAAIRADGALRLDGTHRVPVTDDDVVLRPGTVLPRHPNALRLHARDAAGAPLAAQTWYSVGGGTVVADGPRGEPAPTGAGPTAHRPRHPFTTAAELLGHCDRTGLDIAGIVLADEPGDVADVRAEAVGIWRVMRACIDAGCRTDGVLPGGLGVRRRAPALHRRLRATGGPGGPDHALHAMDWLNLAALAVNEENAAGGRVVTAPTNGAAGIVPAVLFHALHTPPGPAATGAVPGATSGAADAAAGPVAEVVTRFLLTATAIGAIIARGASISGAEVGCQGEVGSACAMAAAGLTAVRGGTPAQVEHAAEIGIEHNLGLTCDPVGGLVQIPCIERNAMGALKAVNAAALALGGDGTHRVSLDQAVETLRRTGADMRREYKETALGGLAVTVVEC